MENPQTTTSYTYANYYYDSHSGMYYLRNRFYDSNIARFISEDPIQDGINWYAYCGGNPIAFVDPDGYEKYKLTEKESQQICDELPVYYGPSAWFIDAKEYNGAEYIKNTNCYAYAMGLIKNPKTQNKFPYRGLQPGQLSQGRNAILYDSSLLSGTAKDNARLEKIIKEDMKAIGINMQDYTGGEINGGETIICLVISPYYDYHFYKYDEFGGIWTHKPGITEVTDKSTEKILFFSHKTEIIDPMDAAEKAGYTSFVGYYTISKEK